MYNVELWLSRSRLRESVRSVLKIYAYSSQRGKPAAFFVAATAATTVQFIMSCTLAVPRVEGAQLVAEQQAKLMAKAQQWVELDRKRQEDQSTEGQPAAK